MPEKTFDNLPPARFIPAGYADLVRAVRNMFDKLGDGVINQPALLGFIVDVLGDQAPETSPDPKPLIVALEAIANGLTGDFSPAGVAQLAIENYNKTNHNSDGWNKETQTLEVLK